MIDEVYVVTIGGKEYEIIDMEWEVLVIDRHHAGMRSTSDNPRVYQVFPHATVTDRKNHIHHSKHCACGIPAGRFLECIDDCTCGGHESPHGCIHREAAREYWREMSDESVLPW